MKVSAIQNQVFSPASVRVKKTNSTAASNPIGQSKISNNAPISILSFGSREGKNPAAVACPIAEIPPFHKKGGVATVGQDYMSDLCNWIYDAVNNPSADTNNPQIQQLKNALETKGGRADIFVPAYNGDLIEEYNSGTGKTTPIVREYELNINGVTKKVPVYIGDNAWRQKGYAYKQNELKIELQKAVDGQKSVLGAGDYAILEETAAAKIDWGLDQKADTKLYKVVNHPKLSEINANLKGKKCSANLYFVHTPLVSLMREPYDDGSYSSVPKPLASVIEKSKQSGSEFRAMSNEQIYNTIKAGLVPGDNMAYDQFAKAFVELFAQSGNDAATIISSDSQCGLIPEFINIKKQKEGENCFYNGVRRTAIGHNFGDGSYIRPAQPKDVALVSMSQDEIGRVLNDPKYINALLTGREQDYFKQFVKPYIDDNGNITIGTALVKATDRLDVVTNEYFKSILANGNNVTPLSGAVREKAGYTGDVNDSTALNAWIKENADTCERVGGIMNGFSDPSFDPTKKTGLKYYDMDAVIKPDTKTIKELGSKDDIKKAIAKAIADVSKDLANEFDKTKLEEVSSNIAKNVHEIGVKPDATNVDIIDYIKKAIKTKIPDANDASIHDAVIEAAYADGNNIIKEAGEIKEKGITANAFSVFEDFKDKTKFNLDSIEDNGDIRGLNSAYESYLTTKRKNVLSIVQRLGRYEIGEDGAGNSRYLFAADVNPNFIAGLPNRNPEVLGYIDGKFINRLQDKIAKPNDATVPDVRTFVSWGRGDFQKAHENTINAFIEYTKKANADENAILILGGSYNGNKPAEAAIKAAIDKANKAGLEGRIVYVNGFAPNKAFASAGAFSTFDSRFEPCGLTELEGRRYYSTSITANTQGFKQKNFDPKFEPDMPQNAYKTTNEYQMSPEKIKTLVDSLVETETIDGRTKITGFKHYADLDDAARETLNKEFPNSCYRLDKLADDMKKVYKEIKDDMTASRPQSALGYDVYTTFNDSEKFNDLIKQFCDNVQIDELADCFDRAIQDCQGDANQAKEIFKHHVTEDTTWLGNGKYNPGGKPSGLLYVERHILGDVADIKPMLDLSSLPGIVDSEYAKNITEGNVGGTKGATFDSAALNNLNNTMQSINETQKGMLDAMKNNSSNHKVSKKSLGDVISNAANSLKDKRVLAVLGGAAAIAGLIAFVDHRDKVKALNMATDIQNDSVVSGQTQSGNEPATQPINSANNVVPVQTRPLVSHGVSSDNKFKSYFA